MTRKIDFINGNTKKCLMAMVLPMIAAMFLNMAYNLVDSLWIIRDSLCGTHKFNSANPAFNLCCYGGNKRYFYTAITSNRLQR